MPPSPADNRPFVARPRSAPPVRSASPDVFRPFVAGSGARGAAGAESQPKADSFPPVEAAAAAPGAEELPRLSEAASALAGAEAYPEELIGAPTPTPPLVGEDEASPAEPWDDELGTYALSEELPEMGAEMQQSAGDPSWTSNSVTEEEVAWPNYALPIVTSPVPDAAIESVARRLEGIARTLREKGPTGPLEEHGSDPLGALITGYVLGISGSGKSKE